MPGSPSVSGQWWDPSRGGCCSVQISGNGGVSPEAGPRPERRAAQGWGNPKGWVPRPGILGEMAQVALVVT